MADAKEQLLARLAVDHTYHPPFGDQAERYTQIRAQARHFAELVVELTPVSRNQSLALTAIEEAAFHSNAAIARNETEPPATSADLTPIHEEE